jgi:hypothetical protein
VFQWDRARRRLAPTPLLWDIQPVPAQSGSSSIGGLHSKEKGRGPEERRSALLRQWGLYRSAEARPTERRWLRALSARTKHSR